jgi:hypothetical protein
MVNASSARRSSRASVRRELQQCAILLGFLLVLAFLAWLPNATI